jgi:mannosyltransferase
MIDVIIPNLKRNYSGVTSANRNVAPLIARHLEARWFGSHRPDGISALSVFELLRLRRHKTTIVWHARRNNEMIVGLLLKWLGWPFALIFTSAGQRHHARFTDFLMHRMDHIVATSNRSAAFVPRSSHVIHHGVDTKRYAPGPDRAAAFAETGLQGRYAIG